MNFKPIPAKAYITILTQKILGTFTQTQLLIMKTRFHRIVYFLLFSFTLAACGSSTDSDVYTTEENGEATAVRVQQLDYSEIARDITYTAHLEANREVHLAPASPGRIEKINMEASDKVSAGQVLVEMDKTQLIQARVQLQTLEADYRRLDTLRKVGSASQQQYDQVRSQYEVAKANVEFLKKNTTMTAPFSGMVADKYFENGEMFSGTPNTPDGKAAILSLIQTNPLKATINIAERFYPLVNRGMKASITSDVFPAEPFEGTVSRVYPQINPATRTFRVELTIPNPGDKLRPGMFSRATLELEKVEAFVVPSLAVLKLQGSNERYIFLEKDGKAKRIVVEPGTRYDDRVEIISPQINPGDNLIIAGHTRLLEGDRVVVE